MYSVVDYYLVWPHILLDKKEATIPKYFEITWSSRASVWHFFKQSTSVHWPGLGSLIFISIDILMCFISLIKSEYLSFSLSFFLSCFFFTYALIWRALRALCGMLCFRLFHAPSLSLSLLCQWLLRHNRTWPAVTAGTATGFWDQIRSSAEEFAAPQPESLKHCLGIKRNSFEMPLCLFNHFKLTTAAFI